MTTDRTEARHALDDLAPIYEAVFAEPPYLEGPRDVADFLQRYQHEHAVPGFRLVVARDDDGQAAGFAYGLPLSSTTGWWTGLLDAAPPPDFTREDGRRTFVVMELAVLAEHRGLGTGRALHTALLDGVTAERVTLTVRPDGPAATWYQHLGYTLVGHTRPSNGAPVYQSMVMQRPFLDGPE
ncbi:GNAT family N-acetyltransferase [Streptomyces sp. NPDC006662]|uniref:GNAT family N-acetyltransferase n=1 Tax=Streptomyces sp. NPDC006662 TaxID=3156902 RepID=UPI003408171C